MKPNPIEVSLEFISDFYPKCKLALLSGSIARNEVKSSSDIDLVIVDDQERYMSRNCFEKDGWPIEAYVYNTDAFYIFFEGECILGNPALPRMCAEGIILKGGNEAQNIQKEAKLRIANGPISWTKDQIDYSRYMITDTLTDLIGSTDNAEALFIVSRLADLVQEFILRTNKQWTGQGKWLVRAFRQYNELEADNFIKQFDQFYKKRNIKPLLMYIDNILEPYGGRLFAGYKQ